MKKIFVLLIIISSVNLFATDPPAEKAQGIFLAFGVGPRLPLGYLSNSTDLGYGLNVEVSYTDNEVLPFFVFAKVGLEQYPGSQSFYQETDYSNFSTTAFPVHLGIRYYFSPLVEQVVLIIPIVEVSASFTYFDKLNEFKAGSSRSNYKEENAKFGVTVGAGLSMFIMEVVASYNYIQQNQFVAVDLKVRIPLFINY
jgi:opacity protein-like surface antigen